MGITPTLPARARPRRARPDVVHVFGFRDPVTTAVGRVGAPDADPVRVRAAGHVPRAAAEGGAEARRSTRRSTAASPPVRRPSSSPRASRATTWPRRAWCRTSGSTCAGTAFPAPYEVEPADRAALGIPEGAPVLLYVGRIAAGKGIEHLVAALQELPDTHLVLVGPGRPARGRGDARRRPGARRGADGRAAARVLPAGRRLRAPLGGRELRHGRGRGCRRGHARRRHRPLRHRGLLPRGRGARRAGRPAARSSTRCGACSPVPELRARLASRRAWRRRGGCPGTPSPTGRRSSTGSQSPRAPRRRRFSTEGP